MKHGIEGAGKVFGVAQFIQSGHAVLNAYQRTIDLEGEEADEAFDDMMRAAGRMLGPEVEAFMLFAEHGTKMIADGIIYAQEALAKYIKSCR